MQVGGSPAARGWVCGVCGWGTFRCVRLHIFAGYIFAPRSPVALDSTQRGDGFSERARKQKPLSRRGRKPEGLEQAPQHLRMAEWLLLHDVARTFRLDSN